MVGNTPIVAQLRAALEQHFNDSELRTLCFDLGIDDEDLAGRTKADRVRELLKYCVRHHLLENLIDEITRTRPDLSQLRAQLASPAGAGGGRHRNILIDLAGLGIAAALYVVGLVGPRPLPYAYTGSAALVVCASGIVVYLVFAQLRTPSQAGQAPPGASLRRPGALISPEPGYYRYPLPIRLIGLLFLLAYLIGNTAWIARHIPIITNELAVGLRKECVDIGEPPRRTILIAQFRRSPGVDVLNQEDRLYDALGSLRAPALTVCKIPLTLSNTAEARALANDVHADIVIWGRVDRSLFETSLEVRGTDLADIALDPVPTDNTTAYKFQLEESSWITFITKFCLSQVFYIADEPLQARAILAEALEAIPTQVSNRDLARAYFLLGILFDTEITAQPDLSKAIDAYSQAIALNSSIDLFYIHRASAYVERGDLDRAIEDCTTLISRQTRLVEVYIMRGQLRAAIADRPGAEQDFAVAIELSPVRGYQARGLEHLWTWGDARSAVADLGAAVALRPEDVYLAHDLAQAQLLAGELDAALATYQAARLYLSEDARHFIRADLEYLAGEDPSLAGPISTILRQLEE